MASRATESELARFRELVRGMSPRSATFKMLRDELKALGNWKEKPRGNPRKGYQVSISPRLQRS